MKILAIRGSNLAALAGTFCLDFTQPPLATAGLFAICGPTGAGKSTLLDALCLALYGQIPRLLAAPNTISTAIGTDSVTPADPRTILRRGTGNGFAEVDFIGRDQCGYRARWSVRRAHGRGKLQSAEHTLHTLDGQRCGQTKTNVQPLIVDRLGLSFTQFTRSVLLAQHEFAAFLKANDNQRAELLENLTGLEQYSALSQYTFRRAQREQTQLDALDQQYTAQQPVPIGERAQVEQRCAVQRAMTAALTQRQQRLRPQLDWHERAAALAQQTALAQRQWEQAQATQTAAQSRQHLLAQVLAAQPARPLLAQVTQTTTAVQQHEQRLATAQQVQEAAADQVRTAEVTLATATHTLTATEQHWHDLLPAVRAARDLDAAVAALQPHYTAACTGRDAAALDVQHITDTVTRLTSEQAQHTAVVQQQSDWCARWDYLALLAPDWSRWAQLLTDTAANHTQLHELTARLSDIETQHSRQQHVLTTVTADHAAQVSAWQAAQVELTAAQALVTPAALEQLAARLALLEQRREQLVSAAQRWAQLTAVEQQYAAQLVEQTAATALVGALERQLADGRAGQRHWQQHLARAEQALHRAQLTAAEHTALLRATLQPACPCPVCGATEHPYVSAGLATPSPAALDTLRADVTAARQQLDAARGQETTCAEQLRRERQQLAELSQWLTATAPTLAEQQRDWQATALALAVPSGSPPEVSAWLAAQQQACRADRADVTAALTAHQQRLDAVDAAQQAVTRCYAQQLHSQEQVTAAQLARGQTAAQVTQATAQLTALRAQVTAQLTALEPVFAALPADSDWAAHWARDPAHCTGELTAHMERWLTRQRELTTATRQLEQVQLALDAAQITLAERQSRQQQAAATVATVAAQLQHYHQQRPPLLAGQSAAAVEQQCTAAIAAARAAMATCQQQVQLAQREWDTAAAQWTTITAQFTEQQLALARARAELQNWFHNNAALLGHDSAVLPQLLQYDDDWIAREQTALQAMSAAVEQAAIVVRERELQQQHHNEQCPSPLPLTELKQLLAQCQSEWECAQKTLHSLELQRQQDDERRRATESLLTQRAAQLAVTTRWRALSDLIGAADGKKFRNYAQQLTLDILIAYANQHLADITRRYRLEREPNRLALIMIDQEMGDERRSVHSLSGGESFLVALALALGLASLSSQRIRVESLFIDEGFGSLDQNTLNQAMTALERLQSQGRMIGVISHLTTMTERIGVQINVQRLAPGRSHVVIRGY